MENDNYKGLIPKNGFIKVTSQRLETLESAQRIALIRKGNEFFNAKRYDQAKRIFLTTGYSDGLIRLGDYYFQHKEPFEALRMYWLAPSIAKRDKLIEKMADVVHKWLRED